MILPVAVTVLIRLQREGCTSTNTGPLVRNWVEYLDRAQSPPELAGVTLGEAVEMIQKQAPRPLILAGVEERYLTFYQEAAPRSKQVVSLLGGNYDHPQPYSERWLGNCSNPRRPPIARMLSFSWAGPSAHTNAHPAALDDAVDEIIERVFHAGGQMYYYDPGTLDLHQKIAAILRN